MAGFDRENLFCDNYDFRGVQPVIPQVNTEGQLPIGTGASPAIEVGVITSPDGSITVGYSNPNITLQVAASDDAVLTLTGDDATARSPTGGNIDILGLSGSKTSSDTSTIIVKSPPYADTTATTILLNSGNFATAAGAYVLPASAGLADGDLCEIVCITTGIVVTANTGQVIFMGNDSTSTAGTATNSAKSDVLVMRYRSTDSSWYCTSVIGVWVLS